MGLLAAAAVPDRVPVRLRREPSLADRGAVVPRRRRARRRGGRRCRGRTVGAGATAGRRRGRRARRGAVTGAFHEDGLADIADAFGGGWTVERRLEILKDRRHGTYGVAAMCGSIVLRIVALGSLPGPADHVRRGRGRAHDGPSRGGAAWPARCGSPRTPGSAPTTPAAPRPVRALVGVLAGVAIAAVVTGWWVGPLAGGSRGGRCSSPGRLARRKIGGISGDVLGATEQVAECLCLVVLTGLAMHHSLWWPAS